VETCKSKKKEDPIVIAIETIIRVDKPPRPLNYPCHICGIVGHKLINCPRFGEMQTMFKYKRGSTTKFKLIAEVKMVIPTINMVDVNVFTWNKIGEKHVFKN
jgi:hypothetical protein